MTTRSPGRSASLAAAAFACTALFVAGCAAHSRAAATPAGVPTQAVASATPLAPSPATPTRPPQARRLTEPGCCVRHWWSADGHRILFVDDPPGDAPLGIYGVSPEGGELGFITSSVLGADLAPGDSPPFAGPRVDPAMRLPPEARNLSLAPDGSRLAWAIGSQLPVNLDRRQRALWVLDGPQARPFPLATLIGGDLIGWAGDGQAIVATGRITEGGPSGIWRVPVDRSDAVLLAAGERPRGAVLSASGGWLAFYLAFDGDATRDGAWVVGTGGAAARKLPEFGAYRWAGDRLYLIPFGSDGLRLTSYDPVSRTTSAISLGEALSDGIAANDWSVSPTGAWLVYRSAHDGALWSMPISGG